MLRQHHDSIRTRLHDYVAIAVKTIDPEQLALLKTLNDEGSETYKQIVEGLRSIHDSISDIKFVYTAKLNHEGKIIIIANVEESEKDFTSEMSSTMLLEACWMLPNQVMDLR